MSNSIRFLGAAIFAWAAVRAVSLGLIPGTRAWALEAQAPRPARPGLAAIQPTSLPPIEPLVAPFSPPPPGSMFGPPFAAGTGYPAYAPIPIYIPVPAASAARSVPAQIIYLDRPPALPAEISVHGGAPPVGEWARTVDAPPSAVPARQSTPSFGQLKLPLLPDRLEISSWASMRKQAGSDSLANSGMLGGSQAGVRLLWRVDPHLSASLRASAPINSQRGMEAALGVRYQPFTSLPVALTVERRHAFRDYGQSAFALFAEGGVYGRPMPWNSTLDGYFQAGMVDFNHPDWFVDGQAAMSRPVWRNLSAGLGLWGGAQRGLNRLDVGPRATLRVGSGMRVHLDYRYRLLGNAVPGSGGVVTLAGDF
jgi:hypothetical protein